MKRHIQIILVILIFPIMGFSQRKISLGANVSTPISLMTIKDPQTVGGIGEKEGIGIGYSAGIQVQYDLNPKVFLRSGINYQNIRSRHKIEGLQFGTDILNGTESSIQNDIITTSMGIPADLGYTINSKHAKINYMIGFGGTININLATKTKAKILHEQIEDEELTQVENKVDESIWRSGDKFKQKNGFRDRAEFKIHAK
jgi:hypothetical protein